MLLNLSFTAFCQMVTEVVDGGHILYRGYENIILIGSMDQKYDSLSVEGATIKATNINGKKAYIIKPGQTKQCTLYALHYTSKDVDTIDTRTFVVRSLPNAELYWGPAGTGEKIHPSYNRLFAKYPPEVALNIQFEVQSWQATVGDTDYSGIGDLLTADFLAAIKSLSGGTSMSITANVSGPDGVVRILSGFWEKI
jgi:hypothetical protein